MARTNTQRVKELVPTENQYISIAINSANSMVTNLLGDSDLSDSTLTDIETFLAAHFLSQNPKIRKETGVEFMTYKEGLKNTNFGQQAIDLDTSNILKNRNDNKLRPEFRVF